MSKIVFPDFKLDLDLHVYNPSYTIKSLINDSINKFGKEKVINIEFLDSDGLKFSESVKTHLLTRLSHFQISLNFGERIYHCVNPKYLGNENLDRSAGRSFDKQFFEKVEKMMFKEDLTFCESMDISKKIFNLKNPRRNVTYTSIFRDFLNSKYKAVEEFNISLRQQREKRIQKLLNFFFYLCFTQTLALNLCTFIFFNWDVMEPITTCITYLNMIVGYYYWAVTNNHYEMESMILWLRNKQSIMQKRYMTDVLLEEKKEIERMLDENALNIRI